MKAGAINAGPGRVIGPRRKPQSGRQQSRKQASETGIWPRRGRNRLFGHSPGMPENSLRTGKISRNSAISACNDPTQGNGVATWSVAGAAKQLKVSGLKTRPSLKPP
jgi:hypothetical protein